MFYLLPVVIFYVENYFKHNYDSKTIYTSFKDLAILLKSLLNVNASTNCTPVADGK